MDKEKGKYRTAEKKSVVAEPMSVYASIAPKTLSSYMAMIEGDIQLIRSASNGVPPKAIEDFSKWTGKTREEIASWIYITPKTMRNYELDNKKLPVLQSELLLKLYAVYAQGIDTFGNAAAFNNWLEQPAYGLHNIIPKTLFATSTGMNLVQDELTRIAYGEFA